MFNKKVKIFYNSCDKSGSCINCAFLNLSETFTNEDFTRFATMHKNVTLYWRIAMNVGPSLFLSLSLSFCWLGHVSSSLWSCVSREQVSQKGHWEEKGGVIDNLTHRASFFVSGDAFSLFRLRKLKFWDFPVLLKWSQTFFACSQQTSFRRKQLERAELGKRESVLKEMWEMIMFCWKCKQEAQNDLLK